MNIPLVKPDLPPYDSIGASFKEVIENGKITNFGKYVTAFEEGAGRYLGTNVATVSSGTMGLILALQALGIRQGDKVIVPSFTFMATAQAILYAQAVPVFADIGDDLTLSVDELEHMLSERQDIRAVLPVHTYGLPCDVDGIKKAVEKAEGASGRDISLLYDAAHAFGAMTKNRKAGLFGDAEVFSLSVTKTLVSVEGGMISSNDEGLIARIRKMRNYGIGQNYDACFPGLNGKMSELHAIVGLHNLRRIEEFMSLRLEKAAYFTGRIKAGTSLSTIVTPADARHTFKDFTVLIPQANAEKRQAVMDFLKVKGIETRAYFYPPLHQQTFFKVFGDRKLPKTEELSKRVITIPFYPSITKEEMDYIADMLKEAEGSIL